MAMTTKQLKEKLLEMQNIFRWASIGRFRGGSLDLSEVDDVGVSYWSHVGEAPHRNWERVSVEWNNLTQQELEILENYIIRHFPKNYEVKRNSYLIDFKNVDSGETLSVNLKEKKFTKTYVNGKQRDIKYPHTFFRGMDGRAIATKIPADDTFKTLVDTIIRKESACSNMGTFLVRLLDNLHLETYISAGVKFDYNIKVGYDFFDKDVRVVLNKHRMDYNGTVEQFFSNNHDLGKSMLHFIQNEEKFSDTFYAIARNMRDINILVDNYKYDIKTLFSYCKERNWTSGRYQWNSRDLVSFLCDYARMAELVFPNGFEKYPKDIVDHHDGVTKLYDKEKIKFDDKKFAQLIDVKMEYEAKEKTGLCVIYPKSTGDIQSEGRLLSHCVGSYVSYVLEGNSTILFVRNKQDKNTPLITIEVRNKAITQARGKFNRALSYDEKIFLQEYADKKKLTYGVRGY